MPGTWSMDTTVTDGICRAIGSRHGKQSVPSAAGIVRMTGQTVFERGADSLTTPGNPKGNIWAQALRMS